MASNSRPVVNISPAALYRTISADKPTLLIDEAEMFSSAKSEFRSLLNSGYRRGQTVKRHDGDYETYCPKAFALIGDVHDTLRDRSIVIEMMRCEPARRFVYAAAKEEGAALRETINAAVSTGPPITVDVNTPIEDVMRSLEDNRIVRVPVTDQERLVGIISRRDVIRAILEPEFIAFGDF